MGKTDLTIAQTGTTYTGIFLTGIRFQTEDFVEIAAKRLASIAKSYLGVGTPDSTWDPLHPFTVRRKGHSRPLLDTGRLRDSIEAVQFRPRTWFVVAGAPYAAMHEFGAKIAITAESRAWMHAVGNVWDNTLHPKSSTSFITIPERSFMRAAARQLQKEMDGIIGEAFDFVKLRGLA